MDHIKPDRHLLVEALALACHLDHPEYACPYLALARREAAKLLTADQRLQQLAELCCPESFGFAVGATTAPADSLATLR